MNEHIERLCKKAPGILAENHPGDILYRATYFEGEPTYNTDGFIIGRSGDGVRVSVEKLGRIQYDVTITVPIDEADDFLDELESLGAKRVKDYKFIGYTSSDL